MATNIALIQLDVALSFCWRLIQEQATDRGDKIHITLIAAYKAPQDIEAQEHILGPLTLKQLIFTFVFLMTPYGVFAMKVPTVLVVPFLSIIGFFAAKPVAKNMEYAALGARCTILAACAYHDYTNMGNAYEFVLDSSLLKISASPAKLPNS